MMSLRQRNRHNAMRLTQRTVLDMFIEHGFDAVTVEQIAEEVGMAASTLYRHFATKEAIVLWDEHDEAIDQAFEHHFKNQKPFRALQALFVEELGSRYDDDLEFQLRRVKYIYATEQVHAAAYAHDLDDTDELAGGLRHALSSESVGHAPLLASAAMLALDRALDLWQQGDGKRPLGELIAEVFDAVASLGQVR